MGKRLFYPILIKGGVLMKILQVTGFPNNGAGSGTLITTQAEGLVKDNHEVCCILSENNSNFPRLDGVKYHMIPFTAEENAEKIPGQLGFNFPMFTTHTRSTATFWNMSLDEIKEIENKYREAIAQEIAEFQPDVIHGQHNWIHNAVATEFDVPVVVTIHGTDLMGYERSINRLKELREQVKSGTLSHEELLACKAEVEKYSHFVEMARKSAADSQSIIVISEAQKEKFCELFPDQADKVEQITNGYNTDVFKVIPADRSEVLASLTAQNTPDGSIPTDYDKVVTFVGKFADFKGIDVALDAAKKYETAADKEGLKIATIIVGSGALEQQLKAQAEELQLQHTYFVGRQVHDVIRKIQNVSDVSLVPSREEPFGLVAIEATACGHPVIATNNGGLCEVINNTGKIIKRHYDPETDAQDPNVLKPDEGTTGTYTTPLGILIPQEDSDALATGVMDIVTGKKVFDGKQIAEFTKANYDQQVINHKLLALFERVSNKYVGDSEDKPKQRALRPRGGFSIDDDL
jgi:glycosyltransferase involved in cell wall biosynthesis